MGKVLRCCGVEERNKLHPGEEKKNLCGEKRDGHRAVVCEVLS